MGHVKGPQHGKGRGPGIDGFYGDEVAHLPFVLWQDALHMFQEFERTGYVPDAWTEIRQVHIPKPDKGKRTDGATDVPTWWKSPSTQNWVSKWWPANAFGFVNHGRTTAHSERS